jgi:hypothetical protein
VTKLVDVRTPLAVSENVRIEMGVDGGLHVVTPRVSLHVDRDECEELTTTLARAMVRLSKLDKASARPALRVVKSDDSTPLEPLTQPESSCTQAGLQRGSAPRPD